MLLNALIKMYLNEIISPLLNTRKTISDLSVRKQGGGLRAGVNPLIPLSPLSPPCRRRIA